MSHSSCCEGAAPVSSPPGRLLGGEPLPAWQAAPSSKGSRRTLGGPERQTWRGGERERESVCVFWGGESLWPARQIHVCSPKTHLCRARVGVRIPASRERGQAGNGAWFCSGAPRASLWVGVQSPESEPLDPNLSSESLLKTRFFLRKKGRGGWVLSHELGPNHLGGGETSQVQVKSLVQL